MATSLSSEVRGALAQTEHLWIPSEPQAHGSRRSLPLIGSAEWATQYGSCIVVQGLVVNPASFLSRHPGGPAVLLAAQGQDVTRDFMHVAAHAHPLVRQHVEELTIARIAERVPDGAWAELLDYLLLMRNAIELHRTTQHDPILTLIYLGQSYAHLVDKHMHDIRGLLCRASQARADAATKKRQFGDIVKGVIERVVADGDNEAARRLTLRVLAEVPLFLNSVASWAAQTARGDQKVAAALVAGIDAWLDAERRAWLEAAGKARGVSAQSSLALAAHR
jgi:hypothetical protein